MSKVLPTKSKQLPINSAGIIPSAIRSKVKYCLMASANKQHDLDVVATEGCDGVPHPSDQTYRPLMRD